jgi:hypothetical protein
MPNITNFEILDQEIRKSGGKPVVLEALWDGDTTGWFLCLFLYTETKSLFSTRTHRHSLGHITLGSDMRVFSGGTWTEAHLVKELAEQAIQKYQLTFYFPSEEPDNDCPKWTDRHLAIHCADCQKLIIPNGSQYLPQDVYYSCHLERKHNERILQEKPYDEGVNMYLSKNNTYERLGYCTNFKDFTIAPFIKDKVQKQLENKAINIITLERPDIVVLLEDLEQALDQKLRDYQKPVIKERSKHLLGTYKVTYNGIEYELAERFNDEHQQIAHLIGSVEEARKALADDYLYSIYFKKGITYRDDSILRFVRHISNGTVSIQSINEHYKKVLTAPDILKTIEKLENIGCLEINQDVVNITPIGKNLV